MTRKEVRALLDARLGGSGKAANPRFPREQVAAAALLVECARVDADFDARERAAIGRIVRERFGLDEDTAEALIAIAERRTEEVWSDWMFAETIRRSFDEEERVEILTRLWEVAYADGTLERSEERLVSRVARELGLSEEAVGAAQARARAGTGVGAGKS